MNRYPTKELTFSQMMLQSTKLHYLTLKHIVLYALFIALTKQVSLGFLQVYPEFYVQFTVKLLGFIAIVLFFSMALFVSSQAFSDNSLKFSKGFSAALPRVPRILIVLALYVFGSMVVGYLGNFLVLLLQRLVDAGSSLHLVGEVFAFVFIAVYVLMFSFALPLVVIDNLPIKQALRDSALLSEKNKTGVVILFFMLFIITMLIAPGTLHEAFFATYHLQALFDFIVLSVLLPIFINFLLLILHDSKHELALDQE